MKVIYNNIIPFKGFIAINILGVLFVRKDCKEKFLKRPEILTHESIHTAQMKELLYIFFYLIYPIEWVVRLFVDIDHAYRGISFEQEAFDNENNADYLSTRKCWAWWDYMNKPYRK